MGRYISYKRIAEVLTNKELEQKFKEIITDGFEIITYNERLLETTGSGDNKFERIAVVIICGKLNEGLKQPLNG